jgi:hypothetical protein
MFPLISGFFDSLRACQVLLVAKLIAVFFGGGPHRGVIIGRSRFCPLTTAYSPIARICKPTAATKASQTIECSAVMRLAIGAGTSSLNRPSSATSLAT